MSKFTGSTPDSIEDMRSDEELMRSINSKINPTAEVIDTEGFNDDEDVNDILSRENPIIESIKIGSNDIKNPNIDIDAEIVDAEIVDEK